MGGYNFKIMKVSKVREKGVLIETRQFKVIGLDKPFERRMRFRLNDLKNGGTFTCNIPVKAVSENIIQEETIYSQDLKGLIDKFEESIFIFESLEENFETIILLKSRKQNDYHDGSGIGMYFQWGVFRKIITKRNLPFNKTYFYERGYGKEIHTNYHTNRKDFVEIKWSVEAEDFLNGISNTIKDMNDKLDFFQQNIENFDFKTQKLLQ